MEHSYYTGVEVGILEEVGIREKNQGKMVMNSLGKDVTIIRNRMNIMKDVRCKMIE